jgi:uncharacterized membrane protein (UPF0127 family)
VRPPSLTARNQSRASELASSVEVAEGLWARFMGLMGRPSLDPGAGLWLTGNGIHMMFMRFPIDAVFLGKPDPADGGTRPVVSVHPRLKAWTGLVPLVRGADGVLELPAGTIERSGTEVGDRVTMDPIQPGARTA